MHVLLYFFHTVAPIFQFKLCSFYDGGRKNISCPRAQVILATTLCERNSRKKLCFCFLTYPLLFFEYN